MIRKLLGCSCSNAKVDNGNLVLSLTDAMTPALWIISLSDHPVLLLKVEMSDDGLFVLQKIVSDGTTQKVEDLAYYTKKGKAIRAMEKATQALSSSCAYKVPLPSFKIFVIGVIIVLGILNIDTITSYISRLTDAAPSQSSQTEQTSNTAEPEIRASSDPDAVGVPLSADAFLQKREKPGFLPF